MNDRRSESDDPKPNRPPLDVTGDLDPAPDPGRTGAHQPSSAGPPDTGRRPDTSAADPNRTGAHTPAADSDADRTGAHVDTDPTGGDFAVGPVVPGFEILGELGRGGMGVVYKARQTALGRVVALKMILAGPHATPAAVARFIIEARAVARFQHPHIVQIFEIGEAAGLPFFSLEYVDGGPLSKKIGRAPQPPRYAATVAEQLARAMQYAHERGVAHRDLKPANILVAADGTPKITDFGLAKELEGDSGQTQSGQVLGTPSYMSPEQAEGRDDVAAPADVYALGAILYDLLTGRPPFAGSSVLDTLEMVRTREPVPPGQLAAKLPRDLETICLKCLQKDPARRYPSAGALADDLARFLAGKPILARPVSAVEKGWRWAKRNPVGATALALAAVVLVGGPLLSWQLYVAMGEAESNARAAEMNARNEATAKTQALKERDEKEQARKDEATAKGVAEAKRKEAEQATAISQLRGNQTLSTIRTVLLSTDNLMRDKADLVAVRLKILDAMLAELNKVKDIPTTDPFKDLDPVRVLNQNEAVGYSRIGEVYLKAGKVAESEPWLAKALDIYRVELAARPGEAVTLRNVAALANMNADAKLRLGDAAGARALRVEALKLRRERGAAVAARAPGKDADDKQKAEHLQLIDDATEDVATSLRLVADADLALGDPAAAATGYAAAEAAHAAIAPRRARLQGVRKERASVQDRLGEARFKLGDPDAAETCFRNGLKQRVDLVVATLKTEPTYADLRYDVARSRVTIGDFLLAGRKDAAKAAVEYEAAHGLFTAYLKVAPDNLSLQRAAGVTHYRLGVVATDPDKAAGHFAESLKLRAELARIDPADTQTQVDWMLALGRCGKAAEAEKAARDLLAKHGADPRVRFQAACGLAVAAGGAADPAVAVRCRGDALQTLTTLVAGGWKDRITLETDPDLAAARTDPAFDRILPPAPPR